MVSVLNPRRDTGVDEAFVGRTTMIYSRVKSPIRLRTTSRSTTRCSARSGRRYQVWDLSPLPRHNLTSFLVEYERIAQRIAEGEAKRSKQSALEEMLRNKIQSVRYPMQELELNYPTTKGKIYSEEEDRYLLCRLNHYGLTSEDVYERIKRDIMEFPVFRFDWFFKSRTPQEIQRRCNTLLNLIEKEMEANKDDPERKVGTGRGKVWAACFHA